MDHITNCKVDRSTLSQNVVETAPLSFKLKSSLKLRKVGENGEYVNNYVGLVGA